MPARQSCRTHWPRRWLVTDERMGEALWVALRSLPRGSGVLFRHYSLSGPDRQRMAGSIARLCRRRGLVLAIAGDVRLARLVGAALVHNPGQPWGLLPHSRSVHSERDAFNARSERAALTFISPVFPTASHPGAEPLSLPRAARLARTTGCPAIALGGMTRTRFAEVRKLGFYGFAGIDCWIRT